MTERQPGEKNQGYLEQKKQEEDKAKLAAKRVAENASLDNKDMAWLLSHERGRRIAFRIFEQCAIMNVTTVMNVNMYQREGMRLIGDWWNKQIAKVDYKHLTKMIGDYYEPGR